MKPPKIGRPVRTPKHSFGPDDFFAKDVRRLLKKLEVPSHWGDEEARFLLRAATEAGFIYRPERANRYAGLSYEASEQGKIAMPHILAQILKLCARRAIRKGYSSLLCHLVVNVGVRQQELDQLESTMRRCGATKENLYHRQVLREEMARFWSEDANVVADEWGDFLKASITPKIVEKARAYIRNMEPFRLSP